MTPNPPENAAANWFKYLRFDLTNDTPSEVRNVLLVIVTLIAAVTFQAGVNPPGGVWQDNSNGHKAGRAVYASQQPAYVIFMLSNTVAFSSSIVVILSLTHVFPFRVEIWVATLSMIITYISAILAVTPHESLKNRYILAANCSALHHKVFRSARVQQRCTLLVPLTCGQQQQPGH